MATTTAIKHDEMDCLLMALTRSNSLICQVALSTGLRISDVLNLKSADITKERISVRESKTGKYRRFTLSKNLRAEILEQSGKIYAFPHRLDVFKPKSRQSVYKDVKRAAEALRLKGCIGTHTMRKTYAVSKYRACGDMKKVQALLNHGDIAITALYALADQLKIRQKKKLTPA